MTPRVSVLMPVFNAEAHLREALDSIRSQTFQDWELIVIDDGSTDRSASILSDFADERTRVFRNERNQGLPRTLNFGLALARAPLIARQDADDIALPGRLDAQVRFLEANPRVGILGTSARFMSRRGRLRGRQLAPAQDLEIRWTSLLQNPFVHTSVMLRAQVLRRHSLRYSDRYQMSEDYDLWSRLLEFTEGANLERELVRYRMEAGSVAARNGWTKQNDCTASIALRTIARELPAARPAPEVVRQLTALLLRGPRGCSKRARAILADAYLDLFEAFAVRHHGAAALAAVRRGAALRAAAMVLAPPPAVAHGLGALRRAFEIEPRLPRLALAAFPEAVARRLRRLLRD